jgi:FkbM family methyltransferase
MNLSDLNYPVGTGTIVDIGMNRGKFADEVLSRFKPKRFIGIEMLPNLASKLKQNPEYHDPPNRKVLQCAVGEENGSSLFFRTPEWEDSSSLLKMNPEASRWYRNEKLWQSEIGEQVVVKTLDTICAEELINSIDLLKIDVQGYEARVLRGAKRILMHTVLLVVEVLLCRHYECQSEQDEIFTLLEQAGLKQQGWLWKVDGLEGDVVYAKS